MRKFLTIIIFTVLFANLAGLASAALASNVIHSFTPQSSQNATIQNFGNLSDDSLSGPGAFSSAQAQNILTPNDMVNMAGSAQPVILPPEYFTIDSKYHNYTWDTLETIMIDSDFRSLRHFVSGYENNPTTESFTAICQVIAKYNPDDARLIADYLLNYYGTKVYARYFIKDNLDAVFAPINGLTKATLTASEEATFQLVWQYIRTIIPPNDLKSIGMFIVDSDGKRETIATIFTLSEDYSNAVLTCDINDYYDQQVFLDSVVHEYGHLLTLNASQCDLIVNVENAGKGQLLYNGKSYGVFLDYEKAGRRYSDTSYITQFYNFFWLKYMNERDLEKVTSSFKSKYINSGEFISELAMKNVREDIAESFAYFVLNDLPQGSEIWKQKILFFYNFPELLEKRQYIRTILGMP